MAGCEFGDTSHQFDERLLVHVKEHGANGWRDFVHCCGSQSGYVLRDMSDRNVGFITTSLYSYIALEHTGSH